MKKTNHSENIESLIKYRLEKANEMITVASVMLENNWLSSAINRLYYGCFYATLALFLQDGVEAKSHEGVASMLGLKYIKTGLLTNEMGYHYRRLFNARITGDYDDFPIFSFEQVEKFLKDSIIYIKTIQNLLEKI